MAGVWGRSSLVRPRHDKMGEWIQKPRHWIAVCLCAGAGESVETSDFW